MKRIVLTAVITSAGMTTALADIHIVGSSTVFPFSTTVAERFSKETRYKAPIVESTGTGGGFKLFCSENGPDIVNASRRIKDSEIEKCKKAGVTPVENQIGFDGIIIGQSTGGEEFEVTTEELFLSLAKHIYIDGKMVLNPNKKWSDVADLSNTSIRVLGPPPTSGTRDAFLELVMEKGAKAHLEKQGIELDKKDFKAFSHSIREDGSYVEAGENDNLILQKLNADQNSVGIFGFSFLDQNRDSVRGLKVDGVEPTFDNIASGDYPVSRSLFFYVDSERENKDEELKSFIELFLDEEMIGEDGVLVDKGLIPKET